MLVVSTLRALELLRQVNGLAPELLDYMESTLELLEEECPGRDPELDGGNFIIHQAPCDLCHPVHGLVYQVPGDPDLLPTADVIEQIRTRDGLYYAAFVVTDDDSGNTHLVPVEPWVPKQVRRWLAQAAC
jgi:hypothetical protein